MRLLLSVLVLTFIGSNALASKARLSALGQDDDGSYFIEDARNIFLNPAHLYDTKELATFELGTTTNTAGSPKAEGGVIQKLDNGGKLGVFVGRLGSGTELISELNTLGFTLYEPQNSIDAIYSWQGASTIGVSVHLARSDSDTGTNGGNFPDNEASSLIVSGGLVNSEYSGHVSLSLQEQTEQDTSATAKNEYKSGLNLKVGGTYNLGDKRKVAAQVQKITGDWETAAAVEGDADVMYILLDYFMPLKRSANYTVFVTAGLEKSDTKLDTSGTTVLESNTLAIPLSLGLEASVKDWLKLRTSVKQNTLIDKEDTETSTAETSVNGEHDTVVGAGLSLVFDDMTLDGTFESAGTGEINASELIANASFTYQF